MSKRPSNHLLIILYNHTAQNNVLKNRSRSPVYNKDTMSCTILFVSIVDEEFCQFVSLKCKSNLTENLLIGITIERERERESERLKDRARKRGEEGCGEISLWSTNCSTLETLELQRPYTLPVFCHPSLIIYEHSFNFLVFNYGLNNS